MFQFCFSLFSFLLSVSQNTCLTLPQQVWYLLKIALQRLICINHFTNVLFSRRLDDMLQPDGKSFGKSHTLWKAVDYQYSCEIYDIFPRNFSDSIQLTNNLYKAKEQNLGIWVNILIHPVAGCLQSIFSLGGWKKGFKRDWKEIMLFSGSWKLLRFL